MITQRSVDSAGSGGAAMKKAAFRDSIVLRRKFGGMGEGHGVKTILLREEPSLMTPLRHALKRNGYVAWVRRQRRRRAPTLPRCQTAGSACSLAMLSRP